MIVNALLFQQQLASYTPRITMLWMQAADVFLKMTCYVVIPVASVDLANSMRKRHLVQSVEAEFLLGLESRLGEVLPAFLMIATITALVAEVWHPPSSLCLMLHPACFSTGLLHPDKLYIHVSQLAGSCAPTKGSPCVFSKLHQICVTAPCVLTTCGMVTWRACTCLMLR